MEGAAGRGAYDAAVSEPRDVSVVDDNESKPRGAAARKISAGDDRDAPADPDLPPAEAGERSDPPPARRPRRSRPFWRKGWFWVGVIAVEIVVVLVLSVVFERSTTEVDLAGGDLQAFCEQARALRDEGATTSARPGSEGGAVAGDPTPFERERDAYLALVANAPTALVPDLEQLARLDEDLVAVSLEIRARKEADPAYDGALAELTSELERVSAKGRVASARVDLVLREQCQLTPIVDEPTTTLPTATDDPGTTLPS